MISSFLEPTFADSRFADLEPSSGIDALSLAVGGLMSLAGIGIAYLLWIRSPGTSVRLAARFRHLHADQQVFVVTGKLRLDPVELGVAEHAAATLVQDPATPRNR